MKDYIKYIEPFKIINNTVNVHYNYDHFIACDKFYNILIYPNINRYTLVKKDTKPKIFNFNFNSFDDMYQSLIEQFPSVIQF